MLTSSEVRILDVKISGVTKRGALQIIEDFIPSETAHQVCVTNVWTTVLMQKDTAFRRINNSASLVVADGMPLAWVSRLFGRALPERVSGSDLFHGFNRIAAEKGYRIFLMGSDARTLWALCRNLKRIYPRLNIAGTYAPPFRKRFTPQENREMVEAVNAARPDLLWVGLSAPKQEKWINRNLAHLKTSVAVGVGAAFDFAAGTQRRAPLWMQRAGVEWLHRLLREPSRLWKRYLVGNSLFVWHVLKYFLQ